MAAPALDRVWNSRSGQVVAEAFAPDGERVEYAMPGMRLRGRAAIAAHVAAYMRAVPDCRLEVRSVHPGADGTVTIRWTFRGTHDGDLPGLPARGEPVALEGVSVCVMDDGLIRTEHVYWDAATLLAGAGVFEA